MFEIWLVTDAIGRCGCSFAELAGELQYLSERFWDGCSGVVGKCGRLYGDCGWKSFSAR